MKFELVPVDLGVGVEDVPLPGCGYRVRAQDGGGARWDHFHVFLDRPRAERFLAKVERYHARVERVDPYRSEHWHCALPEYGSKAWVDYEANEAAREAEADVNTRF